MNPKKMQNTYTNQIYNHKITKCLFCRWIGRWQVPTWMPPHQGLTQLLAWGGDSFFFQSFLHLIYTKQIKGSCLGTLSRISVFCIFNTKQIQGSGLGVLFLVSVVLPFCILRSFPPARFTQKSKNAAGKEMEKKSLINIVDLAGRYKEIKGIAPLFFLLFYDRHFQPG